jgi:hypothetical protein
LSLRVEAAIPGLPTESALHESALPAESEGLAHSNGLAHSEGLSATAEVRLPASEPLTGAETAARMALKPLRCQLLGELVDRYRSLLGNLLGNGTLHGNLLCKLSEHRDELMCRNAGAGMACKGVQERIVSDRALPLTLQVGIRRKLTDAALSGVMTELRKREAQALRGIL